MRNLSKNKILLTILTLLLTAILVSSCHKKSQNEEGESPIIFDPPLPDWRDDWLACWSGVHDLIAYVHDRDVSWPDPDTTGIYLINPDGTGKRLFYKYDRQSKVNGLDWSPDGNCLLIFSGAYLIRLSYPDCNADAICGPGQYFYPTFSPDGQEIASVVRAGEDGGLYKQNSDGTDYKMIITWGDYPTWLYPDSILYLNYSEDLSWGALCLADQDGVGNRLFANASELNALSYDFSKAHIPTRRIATVPYIGGSPKTIYVYSDDENQFRKLVEFGHYPAFSPNGNQIVFTRWKGGDGKLWIINWDGTGLTQLTY